MCRAAGSGVAGLAAGALATIAADVGAIAIAPTGIAFAVETKCAAWRPVVSPAQWH
jgi:hypothetical protein